MKSLINFQSVYFHMGPGFHAKIEAEKFAVKYPHIAFVDQPQEIGFLEILDWAKQLIKQVYAENGNQALCLLGHSFGGQIISGIIADVADMVSEVRLLNSAFDSFDCFAHLDSAFSPETALGAQYWKSQSTEVKMKLIFQLVQNPFFAESYWLNGPAYQDYCKLAEKYPALNVSSFVKVFSEYLDVNKNFPRSSWNGKVHIYYSAQDKLIKTFETVSPYLQIFPRADFIETPNLGHNALFESDSLVKSFFETKNVRIGTPT